MADPNLLKFKRKRLSFLMLRKLRNIVRKLRQGLCYCKVVNKSGIGGIKMSEQEELIKIIIEHPELNSELKTALQLIRERIFPLPSSEVYPG